MVSKTGKNQEQRSPELRAFKYVAVDAMRCVGKLDSKQYMRNASPEQVDFDRVG